MPLPDPRARAVGYLILRHLYDGDIIAWPVAADHPQHATFAELVELQLIARWDRVWPLHDRYRLTEKGIQAIEAVYRPAGAEGFFQDIRARNLKPEERRAYVRSKGFDPDIWGILHDPSTHWSTFLTTGARYHNYLWDDRVAQRPNRKQKLKSAKTGVAKAISAPRQHHHARVVDLDREVDNPNFVPLVGGYDVS